MRMQKSRQAGRALLRRLENNEIRRGPRRPRCHRRCALRPEALRPHLSMGLPLSTGHFLPVSKRALNSRFPYRATLVRALELSSFEDARAPTHTFNAGNATV